MGKILEILLYVVAIIGILAHIADKIIFPLMRKHVLEKSESEDVLCEKCKGTMVYQPDRSFLLPVYADAKHEAGANYYVENATFGELEDLTSGQRGGMFFIGQCQACKAKVVQVQEYLQVRGENYLHLVEEYPYEELRLLLEGEPNTMSKEATIHLSVTTRSSL